MKSWVKLARFKGCHFTFKILKYKSKKDGFLKFDSIIHENGIKGENFYLFEERRRVGVLDCEFIFVTVDCKIGRMKGTDEYYI